MGSKGNKKRILLVDDNPIFAKVLGRYGRRQGIEIVNVPDKLQFLEQLVSNPGHFDMVLIDYYLDDELGAELAKYASNYPVIIVSGKSDWPKLAKSLPGPHPLFIHKKYGARKIIELALKTLTFDGSHKGG